MSDSLSKSHVYETLQFRKSDLIEYKVRWSQINSVSGLNKKTIAYDLLFTQALKVTSLFSFR